MKKMTIQELRSGLHFSASALRCFLQCPWKFKLQYVEGALPAFKPSALVLGKAVHHAIAIHHNALKAGKTMPAEELLGHFNSSMESETQGDIPIQYKKGEHFDKLSELGRGLVELYQQEARPQRIVAVEQPFQAKLIDPRTGEELEPNLVGVFDLIESDEEGNVSVVEVKTSARRWSASQVDMDLQGSLYAEAVSQAGLVPEGQEALIRYEILVKNKKPILDSQSAVRRPGDREMAMTIAVDALKAIERNTFYRNPSWACGGCQYRKHCGI
jgi:putative RecB family exonuclease